MLFDTNNITIEELKSPLFTEKQIKLVVLRLDKIHPIVSGNKLFKLHYFLEQALQEPKKKIITFGGAYSNHLVATAFACREAGLTCKGIVRGERPPVLSHTLQACIEFGMELQFVSREMYSGLSQQSDGNEHSITIPEGGYHATGAKGASLIVDLLKNENATHLCTALGTATTMAGLLLKAGALQTVVGIPVLKGFTDIPERLELLTGKPSYDNLAVFYEYHFGGYAKKTMELISFMNRLYKEFALPTDFVYTAKMMYGVFNLLGKGFFVAGSTIACIHTGGLQGNDSLPGGSLVF